MVGMDRWRGENRGWAQEERDKGGYCAGRQACRYESVAACVFPDFT